MRQKRFQYWSSEGIVWTPWFNYEGPECPVQHKGYKGNDLINEFRTV